MKKKPSSEEHDSASALMALILKELQKSEKQKNSGALRDWFELGVSALEKFGDSPAFESAEFRKVLEEVTEGIAADLPLTFPQYEKAPLPYEEKFTPEAAASMMNSCILFCDVVITGKDAAIGLKYNEENMFAPMIVLLERGASADALVWAAENLDVPVIKNLMLAKNLASYGKSGEPIPEASYRDVSLVLARGGGRIHQRPRDFGKSQRRMPIKIERPLSLELGESLFALTGEEPGREVLLQRPLDAMRKKLRRLLGIAVPVFRVSKNPRLRNDEYRIFFKRLEAGRGRLELGWYASGAQVPDAFENRPAAVIPEMMKQPENIRAAARAAASVLIRHADEIIQRRAPELLGRDEVEAILSAVEERYPVAAGEVKSLLSLGMIREILQSLVSEQVSIRHIAVILETLADWGGFGTAPSDLIIEQIRQSLKRQICLDYADEGMTLRVLTLEPKLENRFAEPSAEATGLIMRGPPPDHAPMGKTENSADSRLDDWADLITSAARGMEEKGYPPIVLCSPKARFPVKEATRKKFPNLAVLSYLEIPQDIRVESMGEIRMEKRGPKYLAGKT